MIISEQEFNSNPIACLRNAEGEEEILVKKSDGTLLLRFFSDRVNPKMCDLQMVIYNN